MRRLMLCTAALAAVWCLTAPIPAHAIPVTGGVDVFWHIDFVGGWTGDGTSAQFSLGGAVFDAGGAFTTDDVTITFRLFGFSTVTVDGATCTANLGDPFAANCGTLTLRSAGLGPIPPSPPPLYTASTPFTISGHINVGPGYELTGAGTLTGYVCGTAQACIDAGLEASPALRYTFVGNVPEPSTGLLLGLALVVGAVSHRVHRPRQD